MPSRLLLLFEYPTLHGGEHSLLTVLPLVQQGGFEVTAIAPPGGALAEALAALQVNVHPSDAWDSAGGKLPLEERRRRLTAAMHRLQPDLVHANSLSMSRLSGPVAAAAGVPSLAYLRDIVSLKSRAVADINQHTRILAVSEATRVWHIARGIDPDKTFVCYNGVNLDVFCPRPSTKFLHAELNVPPSAQLLGSVGQIGMRKGLDIAVEAISRIVPWWPEVHWVVIGERFSQKAEAVHYEWSLREAAAKPPLAGRVHFLGVRRDLHLILNELTLLIHAARQEPLGRVLLEAAASGLALVATEVGGTREILPHDPFQDLVVPPHDATALAERIARLLENPRHRIREGELLRRHAQQEFAAFPAAQRLLSHYESLLAPKLS